MPFCPVPLFKILLENPFPKSMGHLCSHSKRKMAASTRTLGIKFDSQFQQLGLKGKKRNCRNQPYRK